MITALSLGWGVQSWTIAAMVALGELPPIDVAIHADTTWERAATYEFAAQWTPWLKERGVQVVTVCDRVGRNAVTDQGNASLFIPAHTLSVVEQAKGWNSVAIPAFTTTESLINEQGAVLPPVFTNGSAGQ
jgi:hypothetical protein